MVTLRKTSPHSGPLELDPRYLFASRSYLLQVLTSKGTALPDEVAPGVVEDLDLWLSTVALQRSSASARQPGLLSTVSGESILARFPGGGVEGLGGVEVPCCRSGSSFNLIIQEIL